MISHRAPPQAYSGKGLVFLNRQSHGVFSLLVASLFFYIMLSIIKFISSSATLKPLSGPLLLFIHTQSLFSDHSTGA